MRLNNKNKWIYFVLSSTFTTFVEKLEIMKKIMMMMAAILCCSLTVSAQDNQADRNKVYSIVLNNVEYTHSGEKMSAGEAIGKALAAVLTGQSSVQVSDYEADVKNAIIKGLSGAHRFRFNDGLKQIDDIKDEGNLAVNAVISNIQSKSSSYTYKDSKDKKQVSTTYTGVVEVSLTLKDMKTGRVVATPSFSGQSSSGASYSTPDKSIRDALNSMSDKITSWLNKAKPLQANILEGATVKKDKQKEVYIDLGSREGAYKGLHMGVFSVKTIAGKEARQQIGKLKIEEVEGDDISLCKIQSGGKDIKAAIDNGQQLCVISTE